MWFRKTILHLQGLDVVVAMSGQFKGVQIYIYVKYTYVIGEVPMHYTFIAQRAL